jgi:hypothetical protein
MNEFLRLPLCIAAAALTVMCPPVALGHEGEEGAQVEEIVVSGRWDRRRGLAVSASQGYLSAEEINLQPLLRPGDMLELVPGLIVTQHSGTGKSNQMFLRGFNLDHGTDFATWIDGMPINMPSHGHGQGYTDLNFIMPELIESLEFRKGPYHADVADFSSAGAAFFSTPTRLDSRIIKAGVGENSFAKLLFADSYATRDGDLLIGLQAHQYDGPWVGVSEDLEKYNGVFRYTESIPDHSEWSVMLMAYDAKWDSADQVPLRAVEAGLVSPLGTIDDMVGGGTSRYSLSGHWHRDFGQTEITARGYAIDYDLELFSNFTYFLEDPVRGDQFEQVDDRRVYGGDLVWRSRKTESMSHKLGLTLRFDDIDAVGLYNTERRERFNTVREDEVQQLSAGVFYDLETAWTDEWRSTLGIRADYYSFDVPVSLAAANTGSTSEWQVSPKLNLIRTLSLNTEVYVSAGWGYHSNDARGTVISVDPGTGDPAAPVDPLVASKGAEVGLRYFDGKRFNISGALWLLELDSELIFVGDAGNTEPLGASRRYGVEIPAYFRLNEQWLLDLEIALTRSSFTDAPAGSDEIPGSLDRVIAVGVAADFASGAYGTLRLRHFGDRPLTEDGSVRSDSSTVVNLALGYRIGNLDFRLEALNLLDSSDDDITYFYESRLPGEPTGGVGDVHFHPMEPRAFRAHVTWYGGR